MRLWEKDYDITRGGKRVKTVTRQRETAIGRNYKNSEEIKKGKKGKKMLILNLTKSKEWCSL